MRYTFDDYTLDAGRRELTQGPALIAIGRQVFDLLFYLVQNRQRVLSKDDLLDAGWRGQIVPESTLTRHISAVRKAIGDSSQTQHLIRTVARKGFRFLLATSGKCHQPSPPSRVKHLSMRCRFPTNTPSLFYRS